MPEVKGNSYDEVPYESHPFAQTHPDRLATIATLLGLKPPPIDHCRVLELGCAAGGNLIPLALSLPASHFVGVDLSGRQVAEGQEMIRALGPTNIELQHKSILDVDDELGAFDYILCHGVYSWVPPAVQDKILAICGRQLTPDGVAFVSYNTLPGWHMRGMIRDMMSYHASHYEEACVRVQQARNLLDFLAKSVTQTNSPYTLLLKSEVELLRRSRDSYLFHEHLEEHNEAIYFHQFAERAAAKGLRFLAEAELHAMVPGNYPPEVEKVLHSLSPDIIHIEQYMDFLRNRMFRQTLLCHAHQKPKYELAPAQLVAFGVASPARPVSERPDIRSDAEEQFSGTNDVILTSSQPIVKSAMVCLAASWPRVVAFETLCRDARVQLAPDVAPDEQTESRDRQMVAESLLRCYTSASTNFVELHVFAPQFVLAISERPVAHVLARLQASMGNQLTNLRHEMVTVSEFERYLVRFLDGNRDRAALIDAMVDVVIKGGLNVSEEGERVRDSIRLHTIIGDAVDQQLPRLAAYAVLVG